MNVERNRAVLGGQIRESNVQSYVGRRMLLTVEDNAENADRYTFGFYRSTLPTWVPSDAELKFDPGAGLMWIATDAERDDDKGISSQARDQGSVTASRSGCMSSKSCQRTAGTSRSNRRRCSFRGWWS